MRQSLSRSLLVVSGFVCLSAFAYTSEDTAIANSLADANIIVDQRANHAAYRLDDTITRQEVIGMTLKLKGIALPNNYTCKGYFTDAIFSKTHADAWVCRAVELAADRGLITRDSAKTRPSDKITKAEALALAWKGSGMSIESHDDEDGTFYDSSDKPAEKWQENLLQTALESGVITVEQDASTGILKLLWKHNDVATRKQVFAIIATLQTIKKASEQTMYLNFSGEVQYKPTKTQVISSDATLIKNIQEKDFSAVVAALTPAPTQYRTEGNTLFVMQSSPDLWGHVTYSSVTTLFGKVFQQYSPYNPYEKAMAAMLKRFNLASEVDFYALPYGDLWEKTRDYIEQYYIDEFMNAPIVYPSPEQQ
jgi:hypothetical protein